VKVLVCENRSGYDPQAAVPGVVGLGKTCLEVVVPKREICVSLLDSKELYSVTTRPPLALNPVKCRAGGGP
jgi:hypothetical protein